MSTETPHKGTPGVPDTPGTMHAAIENLVIAAAVALIATVSYFA